MMLRIKMVQRYWVALGAFVLTACSVLSPQTTPTPVTGPVTPVALVVSATGAVVPVQWASLSMKTSGVAKEVLVNEDQVVSADQVLVRLEGQEGLQAALTAARYELSAAQQAYDQLYKDPEVKIAVAHQAVVDAEKAVKDAKQHLDSVGKPARKADIDAARAQVAMTKFNLDKAETDYKPYRNKPESREVNLKRAVLLSKLAQAQKDYDAAVRRLNSMTGQPSEMDLRKAESDLELAQANLLAAQRKYETLQKGPDPQDVKVAEERLENAKKQMEAAESALSDLELRAPFGGTVSEVHVRSNEWVLPGQVVIVLADLSHLRVETTDLNEIDVARVQVGDQAIITFDALPEARVSGRVTRIAPRASQGSGVNYRVIIELQEIPAGLRWGMTAFVDIEVTR